MTKTNKKVNIFLIVLSLLLVAGSVFAFSYKRKNNDLVVHADTTTTNFYGSSVYVPITPFVQNSGSNWSTKTWTSAPANIYGYYVWSDGVNYYYSSVSSQNVINFTTNTWSSMTWNGYTNITGNYIWTDGIDYYYSNGNNKYVLDVSTHTWSDMTWNGSSASDGRAIWTDGNNYYYSNGTGYQYVLDVSTHTWSPLTWYGFSNFVGSYIWTDGNNYYYSSGNTQYVLDISTHTLSSMTWHGLTNFTGNYIWTDGNNYYYSNGTTQYVLDVSTHTWSTMSWSGLTNFTGDLVWTDGNNYYYSNGSNNFVLDSANIEITNKTYFNSVYFNFIDNGDNTYSLTHNSLFYIFANNTQSYSISDKFIVYDPNLSQPSSSNYLSSLLIYSSTGLSNEYYIPFSNGSNINYARLSVSCSALSSVDFVRVDFESTFSNSPGSNTYYVYNILTYTNSISETISFRFLYVANGSNTINYFGDNSQFLYQLFDNTISSIDDYKFCFNSRTYYLNSNYLNSQQYQLGYSSGYQSGQNAGYSAGYSAGSSAVSESQYNAGYAAGYSAGVVGANNYSFLGLISAVIDAPIQAFTGLFNFDLLGVNILGFITSLFTLAVIITIVKKVV